MQDHLHRDALRRLVYRRCHASRAYGWLLHLLTCAHCRRRAVDDHPEKGERFLREIFQTQEPLQPPDLEDPERLDRILADLQTRGLADYLQEGDIPPLLADLQRHPPQRQRLILDNTERLWSLGTAIHLLERSEAEIFHLPEQGLLFADLALSVLVRLSSNHYHPRLLADYQSHALVLRGNHNRILGRCSRAQQDFDRADVLLESGTGEPAERARLALLRAILERSRFRLDESFRQLREAEVLYRRLGDERRILRFGAALGHTLFDAGRYHEAARLYRDMLEKVDPDRHGPDLVLMTKNNLALTLAYMGRGTLAYRMHDRILCEVPSDQPRWAIKALITQSAILESLGDYRAADDAVRDWADRFGRHLTEWERGTHWVDRARLALRCGDRPLAKRFAREACGFFEQTGRPDWVAATRRMMAGGPLVLL